MYDLEAKSHMPPFITSEKGYSTQIVINIFTCSSLLA